MKRLCHIALTFATGITLVLAQPDRRGLFRSQELMSGMTFQTWSSERGDRISEFTAPIVYIIPVNNSLSLDIVTAGAHAELKNPNETIRGLTDTRIRATYTLFDQTLLLTGGISLPTGVQTLKSDQYLVAASISNSALDFRVGTFGQGTDINAGVVYALDAGSFVIGIGAGALLKGKFKPLDGFDFEYRPGSEITATIGIDKTFEFDESAMTVTADVAFTRYGADQYNGEQVFRSGNKITVDFRTFFQISPFDILIFGQNRTKGKNERGIGTLSAEETNSNGNQTDVGVVALLPVGETTSLKALLDAKLYAKNENGNNGARVFAGGAGIEFQVFRGLGIDVSAKYLSGTLQFAAGEAKITGWEASLAFVYSL